MQAVSVCISMVDLQMTPGWDHLVDLATHGWNNLKRTVDFLHADCGTWQSEHWDLEEDSSVQPSGVVPDKQGWSSTSCIEFRWWHRLGRGPATGSKTAADCLCRMRKLLVFFVVGSHYNSCIYSRKPLCWSVYFVKILWTCWRLVPTLKVTDSFSKQNPA